MFMAFAQRKAPVSRSMSSPNHWAGQPVPSDKGLQALKCISSNLNGMHDNRGQSGVHHTGCCTNVVPRTTITSVCNQSNPPPNLPETLPDFSIKTHLPEQRETSGYGRHAHTQGRRKTNPPRKDDEPRRQPELAARASARASRA